MPTETDKRVSVQSPAKINLTFDVTGDLPNGYHSIVSIFHAISLSDEMTVSVRAGVDALAFVLDAEFIGAPGVFPLDENNLIAKAGHAFHNRTGLLETSLVQVRVKKQIPIGAGLAGGSSNAAAMLVALNDIFDSPLSETELHAIGTTIGADVPFLIKGGTQLGKGKGEILEAVTVAEPLHFVVVKPRQLAVSTPSVFAAYDIWNSERKDNWRPNFDYLRVSKFLANGDFEGAAKNFGNVFEPIVFEMHPALFSIKQKLLELGAWTAQLSGSGPSIFAVFADVEMAEMIGREFKEYKTKGTAPWTASGWEVDCFVCRSVSHGAQILVE